MRAEETCTTTRAIHDTSLQLQSYNLGKLRVGDGWHRIACREHTILPVLQHE